MQLSSAIQQVLQSIEDPMLGKQVDYTFQSAARAAAVLRQLDFRRFEERNYERNSSALWSELETLISSALNEMRTFTQSLLERYPPLIAPVTEAASPTADDFDDLEFDIQGETPKPKAPTAQKRALSPDEQVHELIQSYVPMLEGEIERQIERLQNPNVRNEQWTLLQELEEFRDRSIGALHAMVAAISSVFRKVRAEDLFPDARDTLERLIAQRRALADLELDVDFYNGTMAKAENDELPALIEMLADKIREFNHHPAYEFLRPQQRQTVRETVTAIEGMLTATKFPAALARQTVEGFAKFLESMRTISLQEVLLDHDKVSVMEGRAFLEKAITLLIADFDQALFQVMHAIRRLAQVYGVDAEVDRAYQNLPDIETKLDSKQQLADLIDELRVLFGRFPF